MIVRDEGIVLRTLPFQESSLIASLFTRHHGLVDVLAKGIRKPSKRPRHGQFLSMNVLQVVWYQKPGRSLQTLSESHLLFHPQQLHLDPVKRLYVLLLTDIYYQLLREQEAYPSLYEYLVRALQALEKLDLQLFDWFLQHLLDLTKFMGFYPDAGTERGPSVSLDLDAGLFRAAPKPDAASIALHKLVVSETGAPFGNALERSLRKPVLDLLLRYYCHHAPGFSMPKSLTVFEQLFHDVP